MTFTSLSIQLSESDLDQLQRVAKAENRRFSDLMQLIFAAGLDLYFCEQYVAIERTDSEIPADELKQIELNDKLTSVSGFWQLPEDEREAKGYRKGFSRMISNHDEIKGGKPEDRLIDPIAERIRAIATD